MTRTRPRIGLLGRLLGILVIVVALDLILSAIMFERANEFSLQAEDASRISDQLVVAYRMLDHTAEATRPEIAEELHTERFTASWAREAPRRAASLELDRLRQQILARASSAARHASLIHPICRYPIRSRATITRRCTNCANTRCGRKGRSGAAPNGTGRSPV